MLFYRGLNLLIASFQVYYVGLLSTSNSIGNTLGLMGQILVWLNLATAGLFFLSELCLSRESRTNVSMKTLYPFTETPLKIILLCTAASTCAAEDVDDFGMLQWLIRTDVIFSYVSYAWKTFWPIIITPVNRILMYINSIFIYILRIIRDLIYSALVWLYEVYQATKVRILILNLQYQNSINID